MKKEMKMLKNQAYEEEACILTFPEEKLTGASYPLLPLPTFDSITIEYLRTKGMRALTMRKEILVRVRITQISMTDEI